MNGKWERERVMALSAPVCSQWKSRVYVCIHVHTCPIIMRTSGAGAHSYVIHMHLNTPLLRSQLCMQYVHVHVRIREQFRSTIPHVTLCMTTVATTQNDENLTAFQLFMIQDEMAEPMECLNFSLTAVDDHVNTTERSSTIAICIEDDDSE